MCYAVPLATAVITSAVWSKTKSVKIWWLTLMFYGGGLFGFIDHLWNRELFLVSENFIGDILLGATITVGTLFVWALIIVLTKVNPTLSKHINIGK